ncbi:MAG: B12-binding domain-containing radical SAM protein [Gammaproteobacteria bacterium]|nr:B12-binding domain-containing radical SAM protein [Gammaproteobacteria bacterium]NIR83501.1 B12-binding domain-containing radical SAM protein [Gammaproteobacteria bacterium]NIR91423.1 B12-binding domain-containing radical SAM protein [Gammaproteobacteria bacterium]NIU04663.1 B12-binding domain-containing radical SAM protein [Gammaproteobacteria bacterium]NIV51705.1 radical SAM protein [Gammaproteobacteria bacterium]
MLLINPRFPESFWSFRWALRRVLPGKRAVNPPLGLATLAALSPPHWEITIVDENIESVPLEPRADIVGVCGMAVQHPRQRELLGYYRRRGHLAVAGGSYASLCPERFADLADVVIAGEAEHIWPEFCRDYERAGWRRLYQETGVVDLEDSPTPRFDLLDLRRYTNVSLQFSRGCPYRCEFCDIVVMFGRRPRTKPTEQVGRELDALRTAGVRNVFFVDDNLIGHRAKAKALLRYLAEYQRRHGYRFQFGTEASLNLAEDWELLRLFREANFAWVFIGIESPDEKSLRETGKTQNTRGDILESVRRIYHHGIDVFGGFIVGFDSDTTATFGNQYRFIRASGIQVAMVGLLTALPRTPLYARLEREGRLLAATQESDNTRPGTNIAPLRMSYEDMVEGYQALYRRLLEDRCIADRIREKSGHLRRPVYRAEYPRRERLRVVARFLRHGVLPGGPVRWWHFLRTLGTALPRVWPQIISDWIAGLSLQDYAARRFGTRATRELGMARTALETICRRCADCLRRGTLSVSVKRTEASAHLTLTLRGAVDEPFFGDVARLLERVLRGSAVTLSLRIEGVAGGQRELLRRCLRRLACHGDRVYIRVSEHLRPALGIDSSVFNVALD